MKLLVLDIGLDDIKSDIVIYFNDGMGLNTIDHNNINLNDDNFDEDRPTNIVLVRLIAWCNRFEQRKECKKIDRDSMSIA